MIGDFSVESEKTKAMGVLSPHAGYIYSGAVAGQVFARVELPPVALILTTRHTYFGAEFALWPEGEWRTPFGTAKIDEELNRALLDNAAQLREDAVAHLDEHSGEVQVPFLQFFRPDIRITAIVVSQKGLKELQTLGHAIGSALKEYSGEVLVVSSSDMTHQEPQKAASEKDHYAIEAMLQLDEAELYNRVRSRHISMCGMAPTVVMLTAVKDLGAEKAELVDYRTSAAVTGDTSRVVGYAGMIFS
jgi:AmmeMemoRadiSam system protein B